MTAITPRSEAKNMMRALQQVADAQTTIMEILQVKSDKDEERDQKIDSLTSDVGYMKKERELTTSEFNKFDSRRKAKVYEEFGDYANGYYRDEKIFGYALKLINKKVRQRARLAKPMRSTHIRDYHDVMDAVDAIHISREEVKKLMDDELDNRENSRKKIWR